jgi:hypothetical protein
VPTGEGLDDWDRVFNLVQEKFFDLTFPGDSTIYVSHQAGTPAISSAVQFSSLAQFGSRVKFLVSNVRDSSLTYRLDSSSYLKRLQIQEAKALLDRYDYTGIDAILENGGFPKMDLLEAAILWNLAQIKAFSEILKKSSNEKIKNAAIKLQGEDEWLISAYEVAYLGVIRLKQKDILEAMFHSFRALEGLAISFYKNDPSNSEMKKYGRQFFGWLRQNGPLNWRNDTYAQNLIVPYSPNEQNAMDNDLVGTRNHQFHNFSGFTEKDLYDAWKVVDATDWEKKVCHCLNLISGQSFSTLEKASIMPIIHKEIEKQLNQLLFPQPDRPNQSPPNEQP